MEHLTDKLHKGRLVGVLFFELHNESECTIFKWSVCWTNDDGVPDRSEQDRPHAGDITYQVITLSAMGDAETPDGGSVCIR